MNDANVAWIRLLNDLVNAGAEVSPRGKKTVEILGYQSKVDMKKCVVSLPERKIVSSFLFGEAHWILSGSNRVSAISPFLQKIEEFSDNGVMFYGAYGPKVVDQISHVVRSLFKDEFSRQAVINIWRENPQESRDIPCTLSLQFVIRNNKLDCIATMRSSDAWLGWVYDVFNFSMISAWVAIFLNVMRAEHEFEPLELGTLHLNAGSQHLYEQNIKEAKRIILKYSDERQGIVTPTAFELDGYEHPDELVQDLLFAASKNEVVQLPQTFQNVIAIEESLKNASKQS